MPYARDYATYIFYATPFIMCSFVMNNLLRFEELSFYGMIGIGFGGVLNMVLDPVFIFVLDMGTSGAAIATALPSLGRQGIASVSSIVLNNTAGVYGDAAIA